MSDDDLVVDDVSPEHDLCPACEGTGALIRETWTDRAIRLLHDAAAEAHADNADGALALVDAAREALMIETGEIPEPDDV